MTVRENLQVFLVAQLELGCEDTVMLSLEGYDNKMLKRSYNGSQKKPATAKNLPTGLDPVMLVQWHYICTDANFSNPRGLDSHQCQVRR